MDSERADDLLEDIRQWQGYVYPTYRYLIEHDFEFAERYFALFKLLRTEKALPLKYKELLFLTAACIRFHERGIRTHIQRALQLGSSHEEVLETIEVATHTGGGGVPVLAVRILEEIVNGTSIDASPAWVENEPPT